MLRHNAKLYVASQSSKYSLARTTIGGASTIVNIHFAVDKRDDILEHRSRNMKTTLSSLIGNN